MTEETIRRIVREEIEQAMGSHLCSFGVAAIAPLSAAISEMIENQRIISAGQVLVEKQFLDDPSDDEPWRESLND